MTLNQPPKQERAVWQGALRAALRLIIIVLLVIAGKFGWDTLTAQIALMEHDAAARTMTGLLVSVLVGYALLLAIPFIPGVEIGVAILMIVGPSSAPFVYFATLIGLSLAYFTGQYVALNWLIRTCEDLRLFRAARLMRRIRDTPRTDRLARLNDRLPNWISPIVLRYRYVMLALLINLPGNIAIGGGGGIMLTAGISRLFQPPLILLTIVIAVLPVPLAVWLLGVDVLH